MCHVNEQTFSALCCLPTASHCRVFPMSSICKTDSLAVLTRSHPSHSHPVFLLSTLLCHCCLLVSAQGNAMLFGCSLNSHSHYWLWQDSLCCCCFFKFLLLLKVSTSDVQSILPSFTAVATRLT